MPGLKPYAALLLALAATAASARDSLGVFEGWGAFRDDRPPRCFAIAQPLRRSSAAWKPFASIAFWPTIGARNQLHIRLSHERGQDAPVALSIGDRRFALVAGRVDAWAPDARTDAAIVAAMRNGGTLRVTSRGKNGGSFTDSYRLRGAATAIDAAALGCGRRRR